MTELDNKVPNKEMDKIYSAMKKLTPLVAYKDLREDIVSLAKKADLDVL
jgi:hypothetical protein